MGTCETLIVSKPHKRVDQKLPFHFVLSFFQLATCMDNVVVFAMPLYLMFELSWLITGTYWTFGSEKSLDETQHCDHTVYVFSIVVVTNFWIHVLTPLVFLGK